MTYPGESSTEDENEKDARTIALDKVTRDSSRIIAFTALSLVVILVILVAGGTVLIVSTLNGLRHEQDQTAKQAEDTASLAETISRENRSICDFFSVIGDSRMYTTGPQKPQKEVVRLIIDSRNTYVSRKCVPPITPPSPALRQLAQEYALQLSN